MIRQQELKEQQQREKLEEEAVKKEVGVLKTAIVKIREKASKSSTSLRRSLQLSGRNNKVTIQGLKDVLAQQKISGMPESDIQSIFKLLDINGDGTVTPTEFCDVIEGKSIPQFETFVKKERATKRLEEERKQSATAQAKFRSQNADLGSSQFARDDDVADQGMTSIAGYSAYGGNNKQPQLIDDGDNYRAQEKIKELLRYGYGGKPRSIDDLMQLMGRAKF
jgi:hypothetical protein